MSQAISVVPLLIIPFALGMGLLTQPAGVGTRWWLGIIAASGTVIVGHGIGLPQSVVLGVIYGAALLLAIRALRRLHCPIVARDILHTALFAVLLLPLFLTVLLRTLEQPAIPVDPIVIWYAKAKALYEWTPFPDLPYQDYPGLGPAAWMLVLKWVGPEHENISRVVFALAYFCWLLGLQELFDRPRPWTSAVVLPGLAVLFFDVERFTSGFQDGFLMMAAGMAALFMVKVLLRVSMGERPLNERLTALATKQDRQDYLLAVFFAGALGLIKSEGAVLGLILMVAWLTTLLACEWRSGPASILSRRLPWAIGYMGLAALWPSLLLLHGVDPTNVQAGHFTVASVAHVPENLNRWPSIRPYFVDYYAAEYRVLLACAVLTIVAVWLFSRVRAPLLFLWGVLGLHSLFVLVAFLSTRAPLEWHLQTAFSRLIGQGRFALVTILCLSAVTLSKSFRPGRPSRCAADSRHGQST